nr:hypothetical protein [Tanacetum cinerariifolium]
MAMGGYWRKLLLRIPMDWSVGLAVITFPDDVPVPSVRYSTSGVIQQYPSSSTIAKIFLYSIEFLSSVSTKTCLVRWAMLVDAILLNASAFLFSLHGTCSIENSLKLLIRVLAFSRVHGSGIASSACTSIDGPSSSGRAERQFWQAEEESGFCSGSPHVKKARAEGIVIFDSRPSTAGKSPSALRRLSRQNEQADTGSGSVAPAIEDVTSSSVTPTPEHVVEDASHDNVVSSVTSAPTGLSAHVAESVGDDRCSSGFGPEAGALSATLSQGSSADDFYESQTIDSAFALNVYHDAAFLDAININSAQHVCMIFELRLRYEHDIMTREKFEKKFTDSAVIVQKRDADIADLKARLEKSEAEAAEVIELCKRMSNLEATIAIKVGELANFHTENVGLDATERRFAELHARIADVRCDMDNDLYQHMLTTIAGQRWVVGHGFRLAVYKCTRSVEFRFALGKVISMAINKGIQQGLKAGIVHGKAGRFLAKVEAYDPEVEGKYVVAVSEFEGVYFPLLDELESLKDSLLALTMSALILKDNQGSKNAAPEFARFQPSIDQVVVPVYSEFGFVDREMLLSDAIPGYHRLTGFYFGPGR